MKLFTGFNHTLTARRQSEGEKGKLAVGMFCHALSGLGAGYPDSLQWPTRMIPYNGP